MQSSLELKGVSYAQSAHIDQIASSNVTKIENSVTHDFATFNFNTEVVGRLFLEDGRLKFEGDVDKSAELFFRCVSELYEKAKANNGT